MRGVTNLAKNGCFGETNHDKLTQGNGGKTPPALAFVVVERNGPLKTRGVWVGLCNNSSQTKAFQTRLHVGCTRRQRHHAIRPTKASSANRAGVVVVALCHWLGATARDGSCSCKKG